MRNLTTQKASAVQLLFLFVVSLLLWVLLTGSLEPQELVAGLMVAAVVTLLSDPVINILDGVILKPAALLSLLRYLRYFFLALVHANFDMARRVLSPSLPIRPALVEVTTRLESRLGRLLLANSITLTPGTLSVDVVDDCIRVHWIDLPPELSGEEITQAISEGFEQHIRGFLK